MDRDSYLQFVGGSSKRGETGYFRHPKEPIPNRENHYDERYSELKTKKMLDDQGTSYFLDSGPSQYKARRERNITNRPKGDRIQPKTKARQTPDDVAANLSRWKDVQWEQKSPEGTFPKFDSQGFYPGLNAQTQLVNLYQTDLSSPQNHAILPDYDVALNEEINLQYVDGEKYKYLSKMFLPTHFFPGSCSYMSRYGNCEQYWKLTKKRQVYPLPPGYYLHPESASKTPYLHPPTLATHMSQTRHKNIQLCVSERCKIDGKWVPVEVYKIEEGFFFYKKKIFLIPGGYIIPHSEWEPTFLPCLAAYQFYDKHAEHNTFNPDKNKFEKDAYKIYEKNISPYADCEQLWAALGRLPEFKTEEESKVLEKQVLKNPCWASIFEYHCHQINRHLIQPNFAVETYDIMKVYLLGFMKPVKKIFVSCLWKRSSADYARLCGAIFSFLL